MKKFALSIGIFFFSLLALQAQSKGDASIASESLLHGKWVVENKALLPKHEKAIKEFLKDTLIFSAESNIFSNSSNGKPTEVYSYDENEKLLVILVAEQLEGREYEVVELTDTRLVLKVLNAQKNNFIDLVYIKL